MTTYNNIGFFKRVLMSDGMLFTQRVLGGIAAILTIFPLVAAAALKLGTDNDSVSKAITFFKPIELVALSAASLSLFLLIYALRNRVKVCKEEFKTSRILQEQLKAIKCATSFCDDLALLIRQKLISGQFTEYEIRNTNKRKIEVLETICNSGAVILSVLTSTKVHVCIKSLAGTRCIVQGRSNPIPGNKSRLRAPHIFKATVNSAFKAIINGNSYYLNNSLSNDESYENVNKEWREMYDSTLVVPIFRRENNNEIDLFICADSMGGSFDSRDCVNALKGIGLQARRVLELFDQATKQDPSDNAA